MSNYFGCLVKRLMKLYGFLRCTAIPMTNQESLTSPLVFDIIAKCPITKARTAIMTLPHGPVETPVFMPVGTQGTLKGLLPEQVSDLNCRLMLGNTYHLGHRPGADLIKAAGGLHKFMNWNHNLLTDSGGFQMVSLAKLMAVKEEGVEFVSPYSNQSMLLTPEKATEIQNQLGADIIMQLDDVVHSTTTGPRVEEAMYRTIRWLDRCLKANTRPNEQNLFPIVQGALDPSLRRACVDEIVKRKVNGFAIGGLSGGEAEDDFWRIVHLCTDLLPDQKPRYLMGVGWAVDLVVCCALGVDMFDCVFPTRTARFGNALTAQGSLNLTKTEFAQDFRPIQQDCACSTCKRYTRASIHCLMPETVACHLVTVHNVFYQLELMEKVRESIRERRFPEFIRKFVAVSFRGSDIPTWVKDSLAAVNVSLT